MSLIPLKLPVQLVSDAWYIFILTLRFGVLEVRVMTKLDSIDGRLFEEVVTYGEHTPNQIELFKDDLWDDSDDRVDEEQSLLLKMAGATKPALVKSELRRASSPQWALRNIPSRGKHKSVCKYLVPTGTRGFEHVVSVCK